MRLLIIEDEAELAEVLSARLRINQYATCCCHDGNDAYAYIMSEKYDGIILDIMLPGMDGLTLLSKIRSQNIETPVLLLTAKDSVSDRVTGLDMGANDYLVKPFAFDELLARIRAMTRKRSDNKTNIFTLEDLIVDSNSHLVTRAGNVISLSSKEYGILEYMIRNQGIVLSKEKIEQQIWNYNYEGDSDIIKVYIRYLRKKIDDPFEMKLIHTVRNFGYVLRKAGDA